jgi:hypothetical protein
MALTLNIPRYLACHCDLDLRRRLRSLDTLRLRFTLKRRRFTLRDEKPKDLSDLDCVTGLWSVGRNAQDPFIKRLDILGRLFAFQDEERLTARNEIAVALQPLAEGPFVHRPAQPGNHNLNRHEIRNPNDESLNEIRIPKSQ